MSVRVAWTLALCMGSSFACHAAEEPAAADGDASASIADSGNPADAEAPLRNALRLPAKVFTGSDGVRTFTAPLAVYDGRDDLAVSVSDPSVVAIATAALTNPQGDTGAYYLLTAKAAGQTTVTATSRGRTASATVTVVSYESSRYAAGETRYTAGAGGDPPCTNCHGGPSGVDHSPATLSGIDDQSVAAIVSTGIVNGTPITAVNHAWVLSDGERDGIVTYLRALPPKGF